ncbi:MAG: hypothetical protein HFI34_11070 [Lachnospiraceae bacterium]|nr:hypothetical protein [Lachnospiraceae bacterium]
MHTATMKGLVGARTNMNLLNTPMRVYKEAERKGDTAVMERAMGYVCDFADKAEEYQTEADKGMKEDSKEAREKAEMACEKAVQKHKEERKELEKGDSGVPAEATADTAEMEPIIYLKTGAAGESCVKVGTEVSVYI